MQCLMGAGRYSGHKQLVGKVFDSVECCALILWVVYPLNPGGEDR